MSRWVKDVLTKAGVDTAKFGPGSTRAATTSKAQHAGVPLQEILKAGGWSRTSTFQTFYQKPLLPRDRFVDRILQT